MSVNPITIKSKIRDYPVYFENSLEFINTLLEVPNSFFIIDRKVWDLYLLSKFKVLTVNSDKLFILDIDENIKNLDTVVNLYKLIVNNPAKKKLTIISIGGGIVQDISGFLASTLYRGVNWTFIPTTLLAQVDSCIGAKTSLNLSHYKNLIGTFFPPTKIIICPDFIDSLTELDFYSGLGEVVKLNIIAGQQKLNKFIQDIENISIKDKLTILFHIENSLLIKKDFIEEDEFDNGRRNILNYGHCIGHAIESATEYLIPHGQAVLIGIMLANIISKNRNVLDTESENRLFFNALLPIFKIESGLKFDIDLIITALEQDKKREGLGLPLIMLKGGYEFEKINDLTKLEVETAIAELQERIKF